MRLSALGNAIGWAVPPALDRNIQAVRVDSRHVEPGDLFVAYRGLDRDAHDFIGAAIARGASAVVSERAVPIPESVPHAVVEDARRAWALLSAAWHGFPSRQLRVIGITGTDGKTTTSSLTASILEAAGARVGAITTVAARIDGREIDTGFHTTTPEPPELQSYLAEMVRSGIDTAIIETTSHALALEKAAGTDFDVAAITNVTAEHLDFHGNLADYLEAKARLFDRLAITPRKVGVPRLAVLNRDDASYERLARSKADRRLTYGRHAVADIRVEHEHFDIRGTSIELMTPIGHVEARSQLVGAFNVSNTMAAVAIAIGLGINTEIIRRGIERLEGIPGRFQRIERGQPYAVIVDFAHTPNSLEQTLRLARELTAGRLTVVFGCAGERDRAKRPMMGSVAARYADKVIVTAEDPRSERVEDISAEVCVGVVASGGAATQMPDRMAAIQAAVDTAALGDTILVTGKGHEQSMNFGGLEIPWDDRRAVATALANRGYS
ncbi:MAG: UDP-N-acetylmuramoyl-L-alanyl-D-glutamate--2,6-diaminopimelate ligase [Chloroflexota bacterium]|nr:MAG: UDP-N-acetylmuramoyl-L-alanyl-D-glutamate--2,6-diaminopimelate ligase [Chloroflexota bacterium]